MIPDDPISTCLAECETDGSDLTPFKRTGYEYGGCYTDPNFAQSTKVDFNTLFSGDEDLKVYVKWTPAEMSIMLHANGTGLLAENALFGNGEADSTVKVSYTNTYSTISGWEPFGVKWPGHTFDGWYTAATGGTRVNGNTAYNALPVTELYAHWNANNYTITFNANGGTFAQPYSSTTNPRTSNTFPYGSFYSSVTATVQQYYSQQEYNWNNNTDHRLF